MEMEREVGARAGGAGGLGAPRRLAGAPAARQHAGLADAPAAAVPSRAPAPHATIPRASRLPLPHASHL